MFLVLSWHAKIRFFHTIFYRNHLLWWIIGISTAISVAILFVPAMRGIFHLGPLEAGELGWCLLAALVSVGWLELWKGASRVSLSK